MPQHLEDYHIPGATVAVVQGGQMLWSSGYGYADLDTMAPVDPERTLFRIASITKLFTWSAVMQLVEEGKLDLNADVNDYLTGFQIPATYPQAITLGHLMAHTAGLEDRGIGTLAYTAESAPPLANYLAQHMPARVRPPGQISMYSNYGAALAGHIVATTTGMPYEEYIERYILGPLEMTASSARQPPPPALASDLAVSYAYIGGNQRATTFVIDLLPPAGAMSASATDMARFMLAHLQDGRYGEAWLMGEATAQRMHSQSFTHHPSLPGWAHGFQEMHIHGQRALFHDGSLQNYVSLLLLLPDEDLGLFVAYNGGGGSRALGELIEAFFDRYYPIPVTPPDPPAAGAAARARLLKGSYQSARRPYTTFEVLSRNMPIAVLNAESDGTLRFLGRVWVEVGPRLYQATEGEDLLAFLADERGRIYGAALGALALNRLRWHQAPTLHLAGAGLCLMVLLSALVGWPVAALIRRRRFAQALERSEALGRWLAGLAAGLAVLYLTALVATLSQRSLIYGAPPSLQVLTLIPYAVAALGLSALLLVVLAWLQRRWSLWNRVHASLIAIALAGLLWLMAAYNVFGPHLG